MRLFAALTGNLEKIMTAEVKSVEDAVTNGIRAATDGLKLELRGQIVNAGLGKRLANTWRGQVYPKGKKSINAAGLVYNNAEKIVLPFDRGAVIKSKNGFWLAIPVQQKSGRGKRMTPALWEKMNAQRLHFIYRRRGPSFLVAEKFGRGKTPKAKSTQIIFLLVPQVRLGKRLDVKKASESWQEKLPNLVLQQWKDQGNLDEPS